MASQLSPTAAPGAMGASKNSASARAKPPDGETMFNVLIVDYKQEDCPIEAAMLAQAGMTVTFEPDGTLEHIIAAGANATALIAVYSRA